MQVTTKQAAVAASNANITIVSGGYGMGKTTALLAKAFASDKHVTLVSSGMSYVGGAFDTARELFSENIKECKRYEITTNNGVNIKFVSGVDKLSGGFAPINSAVLIDNANTSVENNSFAGLSAKYKHIVYATNVTEDSKSFLRKAMLFSELNGLDEFGVAFDNGQPTFIVNPNDKYLSVKVVKLDHNAFLPESYYRCLNQLPPDQSKRISGEWL